MNGFGNLGFGNGFDNTDSWGNMLNSGSFPGLNRGERGNRNRNIGSTNGWNNGFDNSPNSFNRG